MPKIFISYRRDDEASFVALLRRDFVQRYGDENVFMDFYGIDVLDDFEEVIKAKVNESDAVLAIIGKRWVELLKERERTSETDYILIELLEAQRLGKLIVPICIQGATSPREADIPIELRRSFRRQAADFSLGRDLEAKVSAFLDKLDKHLAQSAVGTTPASSAAPQSASSPQTASPLHPAPPSQPAPAPPPPSKPASLPATDPVAAALERARDWKGTRNTDWTPFIHTFEVQGIAFEMCLVPPGTFMMGSDDIDRAKPAHPQTLAKPYWIARYPTTNAQWRAAVEQSGGAVTVPEWADWYNDQKKATHPVVGVTWHQCQAFVDWLGGAWTLPNEPEWEYAARGVENLIYPWGNNWNGDNTVWTGNSNKSTAPVGSKPGGVSWVGALDLSGNVWEWLRSVYASYPYVADDRREDINRTDVYKVLRGGSWRGINTNLFRADYRGRSDPLIRDDDWGFRLSLS